MLADSQKSSSTPSPCDHNYLWSPYCSLSFTNIHPSSPSFVTDKRHYILWLPKESHSRVGEEITSKSTVRSDKIGTLGELEREVDLRAASRTSDYAAVKKLVSGSIPATRSHDRIVIEGTRCLLAIAVMYLARRLSYRAIAPTPPAK